MVHFATQTKESFINPIYTDPTSPNSKDMLKSIRQTKSSLGFVGFIKTPCHYSRRFMQFFLEDTTSLDFAKCLTS